MIRRRRWSLEDDIALRRAVAARRSAAAIAADFDRTVPAVRMRMHHLRLRTHPPLPTADLDVVADLHAVGASIKTIARRLGVRPAQIVHAIRAEGLVNARSYSIGDDLPFDAEIQRLSAAGVRVAEIARRVGEPAVRVRVRGRLVTLARRELIAEAQTAYHSSLSSSVGRIRQDHTRQEN